MASAIGVLMILLGGFVMAIGYQMLSDCLINSSNSPCWSPRASGAFAFYLGAVKAALGAIILVAPGVARLLRRLKGAGPDSEP